MTLSSWILLAVGVLTGGASTPFLSPLFKRLFGRGSASTPGATSNSELILAGLRIVDGLVHKYLNQSISPAPPPPAPPPSPPPANLSDLERLLAALRAAAAPPSPAAAPVTTS